MTTSSSVTERFKGLVSPDKPHWRDVFSSPLAWKLLLSMLLFSSLLAFSVTGLELRNDYLQGVDDIHARQSAILTSFSEPLSQSIWSVNREQADDLLKAILTWNHVDYIELHPDLGDPLTRGVEPQSDNSIVKRGELFHFDTQKDKAVLIGVLKIATSLDPLKQQLIDSTLYKLALNAMQALLSLAVACVLFWHLVTRHMIAIAHYVRSGHFGRGQKNLELARPRSQNADELDLVVDSMNATNQAQRKYQAFIAEHRTHLEQKLLQQHQALSNANERLVARDRLATIGSLVAMVAHELRNPLGAMRACSNLVKASGYGQLQPLQIRALDRLERCIGRCDAIIEEMRELGRGRTPEFKRVKYAQWLQIAIDQRVDLEPEVRVELQTLTNADLMIDDFTHLQVLRNLLDNAWQSTVDAAHNCAPHPAIQVRLSRVDDSLQVDVIDAGQGLSQEAKSQAFNPLFTTKTYGFGMGLCIAQRHVEAHQGTLVLIDNGDGPGATARLTLPIAPEP